MSMLPSIYHLSGLICHENTTVVFVRLLFGPRANMSIQRRPRRSVVSSSSVPRSTSRSTVTKSVRRSVSTVSPSKRVPSTSLLRRSWSLLSVSRGMFQGFFIYSPHLTNLQYQQDRTKAPQDPPTPPSSPDQQWCLCSFDQGNP